MALLIRALVLAATLAILAVAPAFGCYGSNDGASYRNSALYTDGMKAKIGFVTGSVSGSRALIHPMQFIVGANNWVGWGTAKGEGVAGTDCPDDYTNWNTYVDGAAYGDYFCEQDSSWPYFTWDDDGVTFKVSRGSCSPLNGNKIMNFYIDGDRITCRDIGGTNADYLSVGGEAIGFSNPATVDVQYYDLKRRQNYNDQWVGWGSGSTTCEDSGYDLRKISNTNVWAEKE